MADFYLISIDRIPERLYEPRACTIVRRLRNAIRDDLALVRVEPPIPKEVHYADEDVSELLLAARHEGQTLFPITHWPTVVYVCRLNFRKGEPIPEDVDDNFVIVDWGEVHPTPGEAKATLRPLLGDKWGRPLL